MANPLFTLYTHPLSCNGRVPMALIYLLDLKSVSAIKLINVYAGEGHSEEYLKINPTGKIPVLMDHRNGKKITESNYILIYMSEHFGNFRYLSQAKKDEIMQWLFWESSLWYPRVILTIGDLMRFTLMPEQYPDDPGPVNWETDYIVQALNYLSSQLERHSFLIEDELTIADISVAGPMTYFRYAKFPFDKFPIIKCWYECIESLDAWKLTETKPWAIQN